MQGGGCRKQRATSEKGRKKKKKEKKKKSRQGDPMLKIADGRLLEPEVRARPGRESRRARVPAAVSGIWNGCQAEIWRSSEEQQPAHGE